MNSLLALAIFAISASKTLGNTYVLGSSDVRAERHISLADRYPVPSVSDVFKFNILHTLDRMNPEHSFTLQPGQVFAFHDDILPEYTHDVAVTTNSHFNWADGFKSDGWLIGDGVCHLASLMYWAALDAGLTALAPTNHNFADIPDVPKQYGVSIFAYNPNQNLYITNSFDSPIQFAFSLHNDELDLKVIRL